MCAVFAINLLVHPILQKIHIKTIHSDTRPYKCDECDKSFKTKDKLTRHISYIHSEFRNFKCNQCDKSFKTKDTLNSHIINMTIQNLEILNVINVTKRLNFQVT